MFDLGILANPNVQWILLSTMLLGFSSGILGSFAVLKKRSLLGDALSHAALPGVCIAFMLIGTKNMPVLLGGALLAGLLAAFIIQFITSNSRIKQDSALGIVLSVFFAFGLILLTSIQKGGSGNQAGLDSFIFGQAASVVGADVRLMAGAAVLILLITMVLFKEFKLYSFDPQFAAGMGFNPGRIDSLLLVLLTGVIVIGIQSVGVILMAALLIIPASSARLWTDDLRIMVLLAGIIGALSGATGTLLSTLGYKLPTGPLIVVAASALFAFSILAAPDKGVISRILRLWKNKRKIGREHVLRAFYEIAEERNDWETLLTAEELADHKERSVASSRRFINQLVSRGLMHRQGKQYGLTERGRNEAYRVVKQHRLWEMYLMHENQLAADHVHRDADFTEHILSPALVEKLEKLLMDFELEMRLPQSVHPVTKAEEDSR